MLSLRKGVSLVILCIVFVIGSATRLPAEKQQIQTIQSSPTRSNQNNEKLAITDTLLHFTAEGLSWNDRITGALWGTADFTTALTGDTLWHRDTFNAISGSYSLWWGDPEVGPNGGYLSERIDYTSMPEIILAADQDSVFLIYKHYVRCEEFHDTFIRESWDGYNVRVDVSGDALGYYEIAPYKVESDSSHYQNENPIACDTANEWDILRCWEFWGQQIGPYISPYDQWLGGYSCDGTGRGGTETIVTKVYDLRPFAGDTVRITFAGASDWANDTLDDSTLFGYIIDDVMIMDDMDSAMVADLNLTGDTLFFEDFEDGDPGWGSGIPDRPTGNWWHLSTSSHTGNYGALCGDSSSYRYPLDANNAIVSPRIAHADLDTAMSSLRLDWWMRCDPGTNHPLAWNAYKLDDGEWTYISWLHVLQDEAYELDMIDNFQWWHNDAWSDTLFDLTPLLTDPPVPWDTMQVCVGFLSSGTDDTTGTVGLQVDDIALIGEVGVFAEIDIGVTAARISSPNANDVVLSMDTVAVTNYEPAAVTPGTYVVRMTILDSTGTAVFGPGTVISATPTPQIDSLATAKVPLDISACRWTLSEEGWYSFRIWTEAVGTYLDTNPDNDTLKNDDSSLPAAYNYPAGTGELRYHDQDFYSYDHNSAIWLNTDMIAAVRFTPDPGLYSFDLRWAQLIIREYGYDFDLLVFGPGDETQPGALLATVPFSTPDNDGSKRSQFVDLNAAPALRDLTSGFWMGIQPHTDTMPDKVSYFEGNDPDILGGWNYSYLYDGATWEKREWDWIITAGISFRTIFPMAEKSGDDLHLNWVDVSQAAKYYVYRETDPEPDPIAPFDSTTVSSYTDPGVVGIGAGYYYWFHTVHQDNFVYDKLSEPVSEFGRQLRNE